ncbi:MAG: hypothetical protein V3U03_04985, partial [Myxococcota bacterium]
ARAFYRQKRLEAAESALRRGLAASPDDPGLHALLARVLSDLERQEEAAAHRRRADALAPPLPPLPTEPLAAPSRGVLIALLPAAPEGGAADGLPADRAEAAAAQLEQRLRIRLPEAAAVRASPNTVVEARTWLPAYAPRAVLSLQVERLVCGDSDKDGRFGLARLRVAAEVPATPGEGARSVREVVHDPRQPEGCQAEVLARALERALALPAVQRALHAPAERPPSERPEALWSGRALRALFPRVARGLFEELESGRVLLASGQVEAAAQAFRRAAQVDPEDPDVRAYLGEAESTLAMLRELSAATGSGDGDGALDPAYSPAQRAALEARLAEERRRRGHLLAALAAFSDDLRPPPPAAAAALRRVEIPNAAAFGPRTARARAAGDVEARSAYTPDGALLARFYFPAGSDRALLREEDSSGNGQADRWTAYRDGVRREVWEARSGSGSPDLHVTFAADGSSLERVAIDTRGDGQPDRIFHYDAGTLIAETRDTDGDGLLDRFDRFDAEGYLALSRQDMDGDGEIDVSSQFRAGKLMRRQLTHPETAASLPDGS